jgi:hypothetical protein
MSNTGFEVKSIRRALVLGVVVFVVFIAAGGLLWALGVALGLGNIPAFFLAACAGPLIVAGVILLWLFSLPLERRQKLLGVSTTPSGDESVPDSTE